MEVTLLAEKAGVAHHTFLEFINRSVMGSGFTQYKSAALVNLDFTPTFTVPLLLNKDLQLGLDAGRRLGGDFGDFGATHISRLLESGWPLRSPSWVPWRRTGESRRGKRRQFDFRMETHHENLCFRRWSDRRLSRGGIGAGRP